MGHAGEGLSHGAHGLVVVVAPRVAKAGLRDVDHARIYLAQLLVGQAPALEHAGAVVLNDDVGDGDESPEEVHTLGRSNVERDAELVGIGVVEHVVGVEARLHSGAGS